MNLTLASACDRRFLWGAWLLAASAARHAPGCPLHLLLAGFAPEERALLAQFPNARLFDLAAANRGSVTNRKAEALLTAETDYAAWVDADCLLVGDVAPLLVPANGEFQIRLRDAAENAWVWRRHYEPGEPRGGLPARVRERWRRDVGGLDTPRFDTTCVANAFVLHRRHFGFVRAWAEQMARVLPARDIGVVDPALREYFMLDESVLSSMLAFSPLAPPIAPPRFNRDPAAHLAHFGANPKPWVRWRLGVWYCHRHVMDLLDWARARGHALPPVPPALRRSRTAQAWLGALLGEGYHRARAAVGRRLRGRG